MARGRRPGFKRSSNKQYGWAAQAGGETLDFDTVSTTIIVAGDSDVEVRSVGGTHCNLKRIVGDFVIHPWNLSGFTSHLDPRSAVLEVPWAILLVDNDDDPSQYAPDNPTVLSEERVLAHGILAADCYHTVSTAQFTGTLHQHIDVRSNRRIRSDDDVILNFVARGTTLDAQDFFHEHRMQLCIRALLKFPG